MLVPLELWAEIAGWMETPGRLFRSCRFINRAGGRIRLPLAWYARSPTLNEIIRWIRWTGGVSITTIYYLRSPSGHLDIYPKDELNKNVGFFANEQLDQPAYLDVHMLPIYQEIVSARSGCRYDLDRLLEAEVERQIGFSESVYCILVQLKLVLSKLPPAVAKPHLDRIEGLMSQQCPCLQRAQISTIGVVVPADDMPGGTPSLTDRYLSIFKNIPIKPKEETAAASVKAELLAAEHKQRQQRKSDRRERMRQWRR